jgi:hypothetical protein
MAANPSHRAPTPIVQRPRGPKSRGPVTACPVAPSLSATLPDRAPARASTADPVYTCIYIFTYKIYTSKHIYIYPLACTHAHRCSASSSSRRSATRSRRAAGKQVGQPRLLRVGRSGNRGLRWPQAARRDAARADHALLASRARGPVRPLLGVLTWGTVGTQRGYSEYSQGYSEYSQGSSRTCARARSPACYGHAHARTHTSTPIQRLSIYLCICI